MRIVYNFYSFRQISWDNVLFEIPEIRFVAQNTTNAPQNIFTTAYNTLPINSVLWILKVEFIIITKGTSFSLGYWFWIVGTSFSRRAKCKIHFNELFNIIYWILIESKTVLAQDKMTQAAHLLVADFMDSTYNILKTDVILFC